MRVWALHDRAYTKGHSEIPNVSPQTPIVRPESPLWPLETWGNESMKTCCVPGTDQADGEKAKPVAAADDQDGEPFRKDDVDPTP